MIASKANNMYINTAAHGDFRSAAASADFVYLSDVCHNKYMVTN